MSKIFYKKVKASDQDKHLVSTLRTMLDLNTYQYTMNFITEEEYTTTLKFIIAQITMLEEKYGL